MADQKIHGVVGALGEQQNLLGGGFASS